MTKIKLCGLSREEDIRTANALLPDYVGFVFAPKSKRYVTPDAARILRAHLSEKITAVGVFRDAAPEMIACLLKEKIIDMAQLHGREDAAYVRALRKMTDAPILQAYCIDTKADVCRARESTADLVLLDAGDGGTGECFDWRLLSDVGRDYFLAGGLSPHNVAAAIQNYRPYAVDVSSGIETKEYKDPEKMRAFVRAVRDTDRVGEKKT